MSRSPRASAMLTTAVVAATLALFAACTQSQTQTTPSPTSSATIAATASATAAATPSAPSTPAIAACAPAQLIAQVTQWEGAAGHRIATVELTNNGSTDCALAALDQPQLVDGVDTILIDGAPPAPSAQVTIAASGKLHTLVQDGNYCGPAPIVPVTVAFVLPGGAGRIVAAPLTPEDSSGVPPCNGPGGPGDIEMQPWGP